MREKMILLICFLITLCTHDACYAVTSEINENVYIDTLVQKYLTKEKYLWDIIYPNGSQYNVNDIKSQISKHHDEIFSDWYLKYVKSEVYTGTFIEYVDFKNIHNAADTHEHLISSNFQPESYMTVDKTFSEYIRQDYMLFEKISVHFQSTCEDWSSQVGSKNQILYMFYELLSANVLTSYMKSQRFNMLQVIQKGFAEPYDSEVLRTKFNSMYNEIARVAKDYIRPASRLIWMCDKNATNDDATSRQITNFLRGYVDNEINLNSDGSCWGTCSDYKFARNYQCSSGTFCEYKKVGEVNPACRGTIIDCLYIDQKMEVCPSETGRNRRYEYINYGCTPTDRKNRTRCNENGRYFGPSGECNTNTSILESFRSSSLTKCDYCFCYCDEHDDTPSDRYFSLRPVLSNITSNMIVTGVAITKRNGIFSWTITESKLNTYGRVEQFPRSNIIYSDFNRTDPGIADGVDYYTLHWHSRSVSLDLISLPTGCVVTGIRFVADRGYLKVEVRATKFDFEFGLLKHDSSYWVSNKNSGEKTNLQLNRPGLSDYYDIYQAYMSVPDFSPNKFIKFRPSDPDIDAGQTTVPFIDTQTVRPKNLTPLSGAGIYYKGKDGLGGFIAPAVIVYDMSAHIGNKLVTESPSSKLTS